MKENEFDRYFEKVLPLAATIAMIKTLLAERIGREVTKKIRKSSRRRLKKEDKEAIQKAADAVIATLNLDVFKIDANWQPKSEDEVRQKLLELDTEFTEGLVNEVIAVYRDPQRRIRNYR